MPTGSKTPRRTPTRARGRETVLRLVEAADEILRQRDYDPGALSMAAVARKARCAPATVYEYFPRREALLARWEEHRWEKAALEFAVLVDCTLELPIAEVVDRMIDFTSSVVEPSCRILDRTAPTDDRQLVSRDVVRQTHLDAGAALLAAALRRRAQVRVEHPEVLAEIVIFVVIQIVLAERLRHGSEGLDAGVRQVLAQVIEAFVTTSEGPAKSKEASRAPRKRGAR